MGEEKRGVQRPTLPAGPEHGRLPSPLPMPVVPSEDTHKLLRQILQRLDIIEKRLENIEKLLAER